MAAKSANLYARIEPEVKEKAESILSALGIPASNAINMFYKQIILQRGLPFDVKIPSSRPVDMSALSEAELTQRLWTWNLRKDMRISKQEEQEKQVQFLQTSVRIIIYDLHYQNYRSGR